MDAISSTEPFRFAPAAAVASNGSDALVQETRREIASIVRDTADLAHRSRSSQSFFSGLVDRTARAMAAEGAVIWRRHEEKFSVVARVGKITDLSIAEEQQACHQRLLSEVMQEGAPVVVPPTPEATDPSLPSNPSTVPVAIVPIPEPNPEPAEYIFEVFLETGGGPATQRGYLRFVAQMSDLASDFLRIHKIRQAKHSQQRWQRFSKAIPKLHRSIDLRTTFAEIVDFAVDVFDVDRASLCRIRKQQTTLLAVSHVDQIDQHSGAAKQIVRIASKSSETEPKWFTSKLQPSVDKLQPSVEDAELGCQAVVPLGENGEYRLVLQQREPETLGTSIKEDLHTLALHASHAIVNAEKFRRIPWSRAALALTPTARFDRIPLSRNATILAALMVMALLCALCPVPMIVTAPGELFASKTQFIYAPRDGVVAEIWVEHGQAVQPEDPLLRIVDRKLEQEYESLIGKRNVLTQQSREISNSLVNSKRNRSSEFAPLLSSQQTVTEQIKTIDQQLVLKQQERDRLVLRSDRKGVIDGWQLQRLLKQRPVRRGEALFSIIDPNQAWFIEARVPQHRLDRVLDTLESTPDPNGKSNRSPTTSQVSLLSHPGTWFTAQLVKVGPTIDSDSPDGPVARLTFRITDETLPQVQTHSPASVAVRCGNYPLGYIAFQDFIQSARGTLQMYLGLAD